MRFKVFYLATAFVLFFIHASAVYSEDVPAEPEQNAAIFYEEAFGAFWGERPRLEFWEFSSAVKEAFEKLDPTLIDIPAESFEKALPLLRQASECPRCAWDVDYSQGYNTTLGFIDTAIPMMRILYLESLKSLHQGELNTAVAHWKDAMLLGRRIMEAKSLVCFYAGLRDEKVGLDIAEMILEKKDKESSDALRQGFQGLPPMMTLTDCASLEKEIALTTIRDPQWLNAILDPAEAGVIAVPEPKQKPNRIMDWASKLVPTKPKLKLNMIEINDYFDRWVGMIELPVPEYKKELKKLLDDCETSGDENTLKIIEAFLPNVVDVKEEYQKINGRASRVFP